MATRGNRPKAPEDTKGGVRGTHGLGDALRASPEGRSAHESRLGSPVAGESDRAPELCEGERLSELSPDDFDEPSLADETVVSTASADEGGESADELSDEEKIEHHLATAKVHGPGPKDVGRGSATKDHLAEHGPSDDAPAGRASKRGARNAIEEAPRKR